MTLLKHVTPNGTVVEVDFLKDLEDDARLLLSERGLKVRPDADVEAVVRDYLNWARRRIEARPRTVLWSKRLTLKRTKLPKAIRLAVGALASKVEEGVDLTPHLSERILKPGYRDLLLYDWGIHHFHLDLPSGAPRRPGFVNGADEVLFCIVGVDFIGFIAVGTHASFTDRALLEALLRSWPELLDPFELRGLPSPRFPQADVTAVARRKHFNTVMTLSNGRSYAPPGGGIGSDGSSTSVTMRADHVLARTIGLEKWVVREADEIGAALQKDRGVQLDTLRPRLRWNGREFRIQEDQASCYIKPPDP